MIYKILKKIEFYSAKLQGKGYGGHTVHQEVNILNKFLNNPRLVIDIGGNIGNYTAEIIAKYPNCEIHIFEPAKTNFEKLKKRFINSNIIINNSAISNINGEGNLFTDIDGSGLASIGKRRLDHFDIKYDVSEKVDIIRFDNYWAEKLNSKAIDLVKIDVEGYELDVLKGFGHALNHTNIIQFEFGGCNLDTRTTFQDFWYFFKDNSFRIYRITPFGLQKIIHYSEIDEYYSTTNYICKRK
jgi:FkbM family methyltransferase